MKVALAPYGNHGTCDVARSRQRGTRIALAPTNDVAPRPLRWDSGPRGDEHDCNHSCGASRAHEVRETSTSILPPDCVRANGES
jgi:hypothetical protein